MKKDLTIKDIAKLADVSVTTVSRVLNQNKWVSQATREKVEAIIKEHNFSPSMLARGMVSRKTNTLAVIVSDITNPYFTNLIVQIEKECSDTGYTLSLFDTQTANQSIKKPVQKEISIFNSIIENKIDGVIILGGHIDYLDVSSDYIDALNRLTGSASVIVVGRQLPECSYTVIERDQKECVTLITEHLIQKDYQKIGFIGGSPNVYMTQERLTVFKSILQKHHLPLIEDFLLLNNFYMEDGYLAMSELLKKKDLPDVVLTMNDRVAMGAIRALEDHQLHCPKDIAIASCEAFTEKSYYVPRLYSVDHKSKELGQLIVNKMRELLNPESPIQAVQSIVPELILGDSCK